MFKPHKQKTEHHEGDAAEAIPQKDDVEAIMAEVAAAESGEGVNHKYRRDDKRGGFTCGHCQKNIADPSEIGAKTCPMRS